jgi:hypothetical protein
MSSSTQKNIVDSLTDKISDRENQIEFLKEQAIVLDDQKGDLDAAIKNLDRYVLVDIVDVNTKLNAVKSAYADRFTAGCRSRLFWRKTGIGTAVGVGTTTIYSETTYTCTKISPNPYAPNSISSSSVVYLDESLVEQTTPSLSTLIRIQAKSLYGIKYYNEPYTADVIDSFVAGFIGTVGAGSTIVNVMSPISNGVVNSVKVGQLLICDKTGAYSTDINEIVGIGTTVVDLTGVGIASTTATVNTIITDISATLAVKAPEDDGSFVSFTVLKSADEIGKIGIPFGSDPYAPQSIGIMNTTNIGIGVLVKYDNSGYPSQTQSWNQNLVGVTVNGATVTEPNVGGGTIYYEIGFTSKPIIRSNLTGAKIRDAVEGDTAKITTDPFYPFPQYGVEALPTCPTQDTAITNASSAANTAESSIASGSSDMNYRLAAATVLREERNEKNIQIWGLRQLIGKMESEQATYVGVQSYISSNLVKDII